MYNDHLPPSPPPQSPPPQQPPQPFGQPVQPPQPAALPIQEPSGLSVKKKRRFPLWARIVTILAGLLLIAAASGIGWYQYALAHTGAAGEITIEQGETPSQITASLHEANIIGSKEAFRIYLNLEGIGGSLQAGQYQFQSGLTIPEVAAQLVKGPDVREFTVTFLPGATLAEHRKELLKAGFTASEVDDAFAAQYDHPLLAGRPSSADLEGYIYGETHRFVEGTSVQTVLERYFDDYYEFITENDLVSAYQAQGLTLYQGITLASIVQREAGGGDEAQIAQVFLLRLERGIQLGSDVTYQYIADKLGVQRSVTLDNPYNTRRYTGIPPGPIASPGTKALLAVAKPAAGDYLYFLSGDDDVTYFAHTDAEHEANIRKHCTEKCQII